MINFEPFALGFINTEGKYEDKKPLVVDEEIKQWINNNNIKVITLVPSNVLITVWYED